MCDILHVLECRQNAIKALLRIKGIGYIVKAYLLTVTYHIIFLHWFYLRNMIYFELLCIYELLEVSCKKSLECLAVSCLVAVALSEP